jgi:hypothetical protein
MSLLLLDLDWATEALGYDIDGDRLVSKVQQSLGIQFSPLDLYFVAKENKALGNFKQIELDYKEFNLE